MNARWKATVLYRANAGTVDIEHDLREIADLHGLIEIGPHWDTIERIEIVRVNHINSASLTIEQAEDL